jgi:hypothetical protein
VKVTDQSKNTTSGEARQGFSSTAPSGGITNVSGADNSPVLMNTPSPKPRGFRADQLIDMASDDGYRLTPEAPRRDKMRG